MAIVQDSIVLDFTRTPFIKPPDMVRSQTAMPRALVNFATLNGVISAKPVDDTQELILSIGLPREFAYRLVDLNISMLQDVADNWLGAGYLEITNAVRGLEAGATQRHSLQLSKGLRRIPTITELWIAATTVNLLPTYVMQAINGIAPVVTVKFTNQNVAVGAAGTLNALLTFLEYDIEQAQLFPIHWPLMTYSR